MPLILRALSLDDVTLAQPIAARFDAPGGTIGRADQNTLVLPDPERHISRQQARIEASGRAYVITNIGAANPILVGERRLIQGESAPLAPGDRVRIGGYLLEVTDDAARGNDTVVAPRASDRAAGRAPLSSSAATPTTAGPGSTIGDFGRPISGANPFANLLGPPSTSPPAGVPASDRMGKATSPFADPPQASRLPDDFDPFRSITDPRPSDPPPERFATGAFGDLIPDAGPSSLDEMFGLGASPARDPLADFLEKAPSPSGGDPPLRRPDDPFAMFDRPSTPRDMGRLDPAIADDVPEVRSAYRPPRPLPPRTAEPPAALRAAPPPVGAPGADAQALWVAFCEGAGLPLDRPRGFDADAARDIGLLLKTAVDGVLQLIAVRSATRHELHAQVTVIRSKDNNPLKFSPDPESALTQLLEPTLRGFLPGPEAMTDAMNDLVGHAIGTMAGTRAALDGVLARFAPRTLESKLVDKSVLDSVLPINRKAKLWGLYLQHYEAIKDEAQEDFQALFGRAFLAAYEEQLDRLRRTQNKTSFD